MAKQKITNTLDSAVMTDNGLTMNGVVMQTVDEKCDGCERAIAHESGGTYCTSYAPAPAQMGHGRLQLRHPRAGRSDRRRQGQDQPPQGFQARRPRPLASPGSVFQGRARARPFLFRPTVVICRAPTTLA